RILVHPLAGVLSAYGIGLADAKAVREASWLKALGQDFSAGIRSLEAAARSDLIDQGFEPEQIHFERRARLRSAGSDTTLEVAIGSVAEMRSAFEELHRKRFGYVDEAEPIVDALTVDAIARSPSAIDLASRDASAGAAPIDGPALIFDASSTIAIEPGWRAERAGDGTL